ncbi:MAG: glycosyltransferase family 9 protein [Candidatus Schekmanbacteria bacterium]|nr:glycosyltransferase family 9 protein [Candidatus Schekmanbacteria bacterium]
MNKKNKTAVIQLARMGDIIQTIPLLNLLNQYSETILFIDTRFEEVAKSLSCADDIIAIDVRKLTTFANREDISLSAKYELIIKEIECLKAINCDQVINLNYSFLAALIADNIDCRDRAGFYFRTGIRDIYSDPWMSYLITSTSARRYSRINLSDIFKFAGINGFGYQENKKLESSVPQNNDIIRMNEGTAIAFQVGAGNSKRLWPEEYFSSLAKMIVNNLKSDVFLLGNDAEKERASKIESEVNSSRVFNLAGETNIHQLIETLKKCRLLITGDTGTMHLAVHLKVPVLGIFWGSANCFETGPYNEGHYVLQSFESCSPCMEFKECNERKCVRKLRPEVVFAATNNILGGLDNDKIKDVIPDGVSFYKSTLDNYGVTYLPVIESEREHNNYFTESLRRFWFGLLSGCQGGKEENDVSERNIKLKCEHATITDAAKSVSRLINARKNVILSLSNWHQEEFEVNDIDEKIKWFYRFHPLKHALEFFFFNEALIKKANRKEELLMIHEKMESSLNCFGLIHC